MDDLEGKLNAQQIVSRAGMSSRPEYYSGRGATASDLNGDKLEQIYSFIKNEYGKEAAQNYVQMVADIPVLSATDFLLSLYRLEGYDWKWDKKLLGNEQGVYAADEGSAFGTLISGLSGMNRRDETEHIRGRFLEMHGIKAEKPYRGLY